MAALDWIFMVVLVGSLVMGAWRGLVFELLSLAGWVVAFFAAQWWAVDVGRMLPMGQADDALRLAAGFVVVFVAAVFACGFVAWLMKKLIEAVGLRPADRISREGQLLDDLLLIDDGDACLRTAEIDTDPEWLYRLRSRSGDQHETVPGDDMLAVSREECGRPDR